MSLEFRILFRDRIRSILKLPLGLEGPCLHDPGFVIHGLFQAGKFALPFPERFLRGLRLRAESPEFGLPPGHLLIPLMEEFCLCIEILCGLCVPLLARFKVRLLLAEGRFSGRPFTCFRGPAPSRLQIFDECLGPARPFRGLDLVWLASRGPAPAPGSPSEPRPSRVRAFRLSRPSARRASPGFP